MASTSISTSHDLRVQQWDAKAFQQYLAKFVMKPYMGTSTESLIQVKDELGKEKGDKLWLPLVSALTGSGTTGTTTLEGNEEAMNFYGFSMELELYRNAVRFLGSLSSKRTPFDLKDTARPALTSWLAQLQEDQCFTALGSVDGVLYASATAGQKNTWNSNNSDRVLYGAAVSNYNATHATALGNVDSTNDILNPAQGSLARRRARLANPKIRPIKMENGEEWYVLFAHPRCIRDFKASSVYQNAMLYAMERGKDNPLFTAAAAAYDGVIYVETERVPIYTGVGNGSIDVAHNFLCGAQALGMIASGFADRGGAMTPMTEKYFDYDEQWGCAIKSMHKIEKIRFNSKDHGVVSVFSAAVAD